MIACMVNKNNLKEKWLSSSSYYGKLATEKNAKRERERERDWSLLFSEREFFFFSQTDLNVTFKTETFQIIAPNVRFSSLESKRDVSAGPLGSPFFAQNA